MRPKQQRGFISTLVMVIIGSILASCGGEGSGKGGGGGGITSAAALKSAFNAFDVALSSDNNNQPAKSFLKKPDTTDLGDPEKILQRFEQFQDSFHARRTKGLEAALVQSFGCPDGGTQVITINDQGTTEQVDDSYTLTADRCAGTIEGVRVFIDGTFFFEPLPNGYRKVYIHFLQRTTDASGRTTELTNDGIIKVTGNAAACGDKLVFGDATLSINLTGAGRLEETGEGTLERNQSFSMENFTMIASGQYSAAPDCLPTATTFTLSGGMNSTDHLNTENNYRVNFEALEMILTRIRSVQGAHTGNTLELNGAVEIDSTCTAGRFTLSTPAEDPLVFQARNSCAVGGRTLITKDNVTTAVIATAGGGLQIDDGNDGLLEEEFSDCKEAKTCT